jgi:UDP-N-acetylmuramate--alanine ligase
MVVEADESDGSFLQAAGRRSRSSPTSIPSTSTTAGTFEAVQGGVPTSSSQNVPFYGFAVLCIDHPGGAGR